MDLHLILLLFVLRCAHCAGQYGGEKDCQTDARNYECTQGTKCTVTCSASCSNERQGKPIQGTRIYSLNSPICRSAVHDYRISPADSSKSNVTFVTSGDDTKRYLASIQQGMSSINFGNPKGYFYFSSPYFTEEILDVSTLNYDYFYPRSHSFIQECRVAGSKAKIQDFHLPLGASRNGSPSEGGELMTWSNPQAGGYWCNIANNSYSDVMSLAMSSDAHAIPDKWTVVTSIKEKVTLKFIPNKGVPLPTTLPTWKKDGKYMPISNNGSNIRQSHNSSGCYLEIEDVDVGDSAIYSAEFDQEEDANEKQGIVRLIVRKCRKDTFGPKCEHRCPECLNGGVCHDVMGKCLCPPGFTGALCEKSCPTGYFGQRCTQSCASSQKAIDNSCKGALICLPDPFGCSCAVGYSGITCNEDSTSTTLPTRSTRTRTTTRSTTAQTTRRRTTLASTTTSKHTQITKKPVTASSSTLTKIKRKPTTAASSTTSSMVTKITRKPTTAASSVRSMLNQITRQPTTAASRTTRNRPVTITTSPISTSARPIITNSTSKQERICQSLASTGTLVVSSANPCQYGCVIESDRRNIFSILKTDGEQCQHGICFKGVCQERYEKTVCPEDFSGVRINCKEYCYSLKFPGMPILMNVMDGELCIEEVTHGNCMNGKCVVLQSIWK